MYKLVIWRQLFNWSWSLNPMVWGFIKLLLKIWLGKMLDTPVRKRMVPGNYSWTTSRPLSSDLQSEEACFLSGFQTGRLRTLLSRHLGGPRGNQMIQDLEAALLIPPSHNTSVLLSVWYIGFLFRTIFFCCCCSGLSLKKTSQLLTISF